MARATAFCHKGRKAGAKSKGDGNDFFCHGKHGKHGYGNGDGNDFFCHGKHGKHGSRNGDDSDKDLQAQATTVAKLTRQAA